MVFTICFFLFVFFCIWVGLTNAKWSLEPPQNFRFYWRGKEYWYSRSMATAAFIFTKTNDGWGVLANKRGKGTPDFQGMWNCPCGYLEHNITLEENCVKEVFEETNLTIDKEHLQMVGINSNPSENHQNVTVRFMSVIDNIDIESLNSKNSETNEVDEIAIIPLSQIDNYEWAFGHDVIVKELSSKL